MEIAQQIGRLEGRVESLERQVAAERAESARAYEKIDTRLASIDGRLDDIAKKDALRVGTVHGAAWVLGTVFAAASLVAGSIWAVVTSIIQRH